MSSSASWCTADVQTRGAGEALVNKGRRGKTADQFDSIIFNHHLLIHQQRRLRLVEEMVITRRTRAVAAPLDTRTRGAWHVLGFFLDVRRLITSAILSSVACGGTLRRLLLLTFLLE